MAIVALTISDVIKQSDMRKCFAIRWTRFIYFSGLIPVREGGGQICFPSFHSVNIAFIADCLTLDRSV